VGVSGKLWNTINIVGLRNSKLLVMVLPYKYGDSPLNPLYIAKSG